MFPNPKRQCRVRSAVFAPRNWQQSVCGRRLKTPHSSLTARSRCEHVQRVFVVCICSAGRTLLLHVDVSFSRARAFFARVRVRRERSPPRFSRALNLCRAHRAENRTTKTCTLCVCVCVCRVGSRLGSDRRRSRRRRRLLISAIPRAVFTSVFPADCYMLLLTVSVRARRRRRP